MCPACINIWVRDLDNYRHLVEKISKCPPQYAKKDTRKINHGNKGVGLGNGHKKNENYVKFVFENRQYLRHDLKLCEKATQKILCYSNNFLHKKLKTEPGKLTFLQRSSRLIKLKSLIPIMDLPEMTCCKGNCVKLAKTHPLLLENWRERASSDQSEARRVIAEMLTPCRFNSRNCFKFIIYVTGCSFGTISKVNLHMKNSGGSREPPEHGLKRWWREQSRKNDAESSVEASGRSQHRSHLQNQSDHELEISFIHEDVPVSSAIGNNNVQINSSDPLLSIFPSQDFETIIYIEDWFMVYGLWFMVMICDEVFVDFAIFILMLFTANSKHVHGVANLKDSSNKENPVDELKGCQKTGMEVNQPSKLSRIEVFEEIARTTSWNAVMVSRDFKNLVVPVATIPPRLTGRERPWERHTFQAEGNRCEEEDP
ncbi:hypothetical protein GQR58_010756 [Nymphon striatum]|nr:hypothetical protein GQR58_010756 [Nymphon striatum]